MYLQNRCIFLYFHGVAPGPPPPGLAYLKTDKPMRAMTSPTIERLHPMYVITSNTSPCVPGKVG